MSQLKKRLQKLEQHDERKNSGVFFVGIENDEYMVKLSGDRLVFKGNKADYEQFIKKHADSVFIVDDIPREGKIDLSTWTYEELKIAEKWLESGKSTPLPEELKHLIEL